MTKPNISKLNNTINAPISSRPPSLSNYRIKPNRISDILESFGLDPEKAVTPQKYKSLGFNRKTWYSMLRNDIEMTITQAESVSEWLSSFVNLDEVGGMWKIEKRAS